MYLLAQGVSSGSAAATIMPNDTDLCLPSLFRADSGGCVQSLQELVDTAIQSESPHQPQLVISPNWLTGAGTDSQEVWRALQSLGMSSTSAAGACQTPCCEM